VMLAAASITRQSKAIAIVVSSSGTIRVFKGGRAIFVVGRM
jgi:DNA integrity scanning protein DisA with diadenylate cyclase activity